MEESRDPYAPPNSDILIAPEKQGPGVKRVFSPAQASFGVLLGGPVPGTYFVAMNFLALGDTKRARLTAILGIAITAAILLWHYLMPEGPLNYGISIPYSIAAWLIIKRAQFTKAQIVASKTLTFHSNWRVGGLALLGLVFTVVVARVLSHLLSGR
jgi:hypothetical protein